LIEIKEELIKEKSDTNQFLDIEFVSTHARLYLEEYIGIKIGNINLERIHFPKEFSETKTKIQQNHYTQLQLNIENETKILSKENEQKLININTKTECDRVMAIAEMKKRETMVVTETESLRIIKLADTESQRIIKLAEAKKDEKIILAKAQSSELEIMNKSIKENPEAYQLKILSLSSDAWKGVASSTSSKLIITDGDPTGKPLSFINQLALTKEILEK